MKLYGIKNLQIIIVNQRICKLIHIEIIIDFYFDPLIISLFISQQFYTLYIHIARIRVTKISMQVEIT